MARRDGRGKKKRRRRKGCLYKLLLLILTGAVLFMGYRWLDANAFKGLRVARLTNTAMPDWIDVQIIDVDGASRRGEKLEDVRDIVVHYVANPGTSAQNNHDFYTNADSETSSHFVVGLSGEIIQCIPLDEKSSASNWRNNDTISIEVCHPDETGQFTDKSYSALVKLTAWLEKISGLKEDNVIRHYDITGKKCPLYFVEHEDAWKQFKEDVKKYRKEGEQVKK